MHNSSAPITETYEVMPIYRKEIIRMSISVDFYMQLVVECAMAQSKRRKRSSLIFRVQDGVPASSGARDCKVSEKLLLHVPIFGVWESRPTLARHGLKLDWNRRGKIKDDSPRPLYTKEHVKSAHPPEIIRENVKVSRPLRAYVSRPSL